MAKEVPNSFDYDALLESFRTFLKSQEQFKDYNFDGSGINVILRALAYNMAMQAYSDNMLFNESFLTTAEKYGSVGSAAAFLSYCPRSATSARAGIDLLVQGDVSTPSTIDLNRADAFFSELDNNTYTFTPATTYTASKDVNNQYLFSDVVLVEGTVNSNTFVQQGTAVQTFTIPNKGIDISTLVVRVYPSSTSTSFDTYDRFTRGTQLGALSKVYFLEMNLDGFYQIEFGDGHLAAAIDSGSVVYVEYLLTQGSAANGCNVFTSNFDLVENGTNYITVTSPAQGGDSAETIPSIRNNARFGFSAQDSLVTESDYSYYVKSNYGNIVKDAIAYGGDKLEPPKNGYVYVSVRTKTGEALSEVIKNEIVANVDKLNVGTITPVIVDANETKVLLDVSANYSNLNNATDAGTIESGIIATVSDFSEKNIEIFGGKFIASDIVVQIKNSSKAISTLTFGVSYQQAQIGELNTPLTFDFLFNNRLYPTSVYINHFKLLDADPDATYHITDDGLGVLRLHRVANGVEAVVKTIGTVNYETGKVSVKNISVVTLDPITCTVKPLAIDVDYEPVSGEIVSCEVSTISVTPN